MSIFTNIASLSPADVGMITGIGFKAFIILADSMPPPAEDCGYFMRWFYDAVQKAASNGLKVGATRSSSAPPATVLAKPAEVAKSDVVVNT